MGHIFFHAVFNTGIARILNGLCPRGARMNSGWSGVTDDPDPPPPSAPSNHLQVKPICICYQESMRPMSQYFALGQLCVCYQLGRVRTA